MKCGQKQHASHSSLTPPQGPLSSFTLLFCLLDSETLAKNSKALEGGRATLWKEHGSLGNHVGTVPLPSPQPSCSGHGYEQEIPLCGTLLSVRVLVKAHHADWYILRA